MSFFDNPFKLFLQPPSQKLMSGFGGEVREFVGQLADSGNLILGIPAITIVIKARNSGTKHIISHV